MENIWSENKYLNGFINILIILLSMNFLNYGQIIVPIICLLIFIDNKFQFKVNNIKVFVLLILFGVSLLAFSYKLGIYSTIGLFLPMAYYVGSNLKNKNEESLKNVIYLIALGMSIHLLLNFGYDLLSRGIACFQRNSHLDFWTRDEYPTTQSAINYVFVYSTIYYLFCYEKNKKYRYIGFIIFLINFVYSFALGRRTSFVLLTTAIILSILLDKFILKNNSKINNIILGLLLIVLAFIFALFAIVKLEIIELPYELSHLSIINKLLLFGTSSSRLDIIVETIKLAPSHLFGGQEISTILDIEPHNLWLNVFDYGGIIPMVLIIIYTIYLFKLMIVDMKKVKNLEIMSLLIVLLVLSFIQICMEPILTGGSIFLISLVLIVTIVESLYNVKEVK